MVPGLLAIAALGTPWWAVAVIAACAALAVASGLGFAQDGPAGGGTGEPNPPGEGGGEPQYITQEALNSALAEQRRRADRQHETTTKALKALTDTVGGLSEGGGGTDDDDSGPAPGDGGKPPEGTAAELAALRKRVDKYGSQVEAAEARANEERRLRLEGERDREIVNVLTEARVHSTDDGLSVFAKRCRYQATEDGKGGQWLYRTKDGEELPIRDGLPEEIPDYMKQPAGVGAGAGSASGGRATGGDTVAVQLAAKVKERDGLVKAAQESGGRPTDEDLMRVQAVETEIKALTAQSKSGTK